MKPYLSYKRYRRGKNRCLECGMKLDDKKHCGGDHIKIFGNLLKFVYARGVCNQFKKRSLMYDILSKKATSDKKGYYFATKRMGL